MNGYFGICLGMVTCKVVASHDFKEWFSIHQDKTFCLRTGVVTLSQLGLF